MEMKTVHIGDLCLKVCSGGTPKSSNKDFYNPLTIPWLTTSEVNYTRITSTKKGISENGLNHSSAKLIPINSVIVAMYGQGDTAGRVAINKIPLATNQACCNLILNPELADYNYIYYALTANYNKLVILKSGGAQPNLNLGKIKDFEIQIPALEVQKKIGKILSAYDDMIDNCKKQIALLEEAAGRLYREWFIDLRFPGHETTPISEDGLPQGWKYIPLEAIADYINGFAFKPAHWHNNGKPIIKIKELNEGVTESTPRYHGDDIPSKYNITSGDIIFSWSATLTAKIWDGEDGILNQHLFKVIPNNGFSREFVLQSILKTLATFRSMANGSTMQHIQRGKLSEVKIIKPAADIMLRYNKIAQPLQNAILNISKQKLKLKEAFELLLPRLISGQIEISVTEVDTNSSVATDEFGVNEHE